MTQQIQQDIVPVTSDVPEVAAFARTVLASQRRAKGCRGTLAPAYGDPSITQTCQLPDGTRRVRHAGLFGQTWLSCEVSAPSAAAAGIRGRADAWCVQVANALNTAR